MELRSSVITVDENSEKEVTDGDGSEVSGSRPKEFKRLLINAVRKRPALYDREHEDYYKKKLHTWQEVGTLVGATEDEARSTWKKLRSKYLRERRKILSGKTDTGKAAVTYPTWYLMGELGFLEPLHYMKQSYSNVDESYKLLLTDTSNKNATLGGVSTASSDNSTDVFMDENVQPVLQQCDVTAGPSTRPSNSASTSKESLKDFPVLDIYSSPPPGKWTTPQNFRAREKGNASGGERTFLTPNAAPKRPRNSHSGSTQSSGATSMKSWKEMNVALEKQLGDIVLKLDTCFDQLKNPPSSKEQLVDDFVRYLRTVLLRFDESEMLDIQRDVIELISRARKENVKK